MKARSVQNANHWITLMTLDAQLFIWHWLLTFFLCLLVNGSISELFAKNNSLSWVCVCVRIKS